jgi:5'-nucleotidase
MNDQLLNPVVLIDMDGVIADFDTELAARIAKRLPHINLLEQQKNFYFSDDYPEHATLIRELSDEKGFFISLPVMNHAIEGWQRIIDLGYHPRICSSPIKTNPYSKSEKLEWLQRHFAPVFGESVVEEAIITSDKYLCDGIALIDDRPEVKNAQEASWQHIIFDRPFNTDVTLPRLRGWDDDNLARLLHDARAAYSK